jgi:hypothetical protein
MQSLRSGSQSRLVRALSCSTWLIHQAALKERAALIIVSPHGRTGFRRVFLGRVAEGSVRSAAYPVLVVPSFAHAKNERQFAISAKPESDLFRRMEA